MHRHSFSPSQLESCFLSRQYAHTHIRPHALPRGFYQADPLTVARRLLGCRLVRSREVGLTTGMIIETESYHGPGDSASHARHGKTTRNAVLFGEAWHAYVYFIYGRYSMLNVVTGMPGDAGAVLLRAAVADPPAVGKRTADGPGRLCRHFSVDRSLNGWDLTIGEALWIEPFRELPDSDIETTPRIGIDYARPEDREALRRFRIRRDKVTE